MGARKSVITKELEEKLLRTTELLQGSQNRVNASIAIIRDLEKVRRSLRTMFGEK